MALTIDEVLRQAFPVMPVLVLEDVGLALETVGALQAGGIQVLEVTLRTPQALKALAAIRQAFPTLLVGAGTLTHSHQFAEAREAGAQFIVSPGLTERLAAAAEGAGLPYLPGVMTPSDVLLALEYGFRSQKLFPANGNASLPLLEALKGPFTDIRFCPTGGITSENLLHFLRLSNVACVGGSWIAPAKLIRAQAWSRISQLAAEARELAVTLEQAP